MVSLKCAMCICFLYMYTLCHHQLQAISSKTIKVHVGRSFVEHVADTQSFGPWRPNSVALADFAEHGSGVVLCRLWPDPTKVAGGDVGGWWFNGWGRLVWGGGSGGLWGCWDGL